MFINLQGCITNQQDRNEKKIINAGIATSAGGNICK